MICSPIHLVKFIGGCKGHLGNLLVSLCEKPIPLPISSQSSFVNGTDNMCFKIL